MDVKHEAYWRSCLQSRVQATQMRVLRKIEGVNKVDLVERRQEMWLQRLQGMNNDAGRDWESTGALTSINCRSWMTHWRNRERQQNWASASKLVCRLSTIWWKRWLNMIYYLSWPKITNQELQIYVTDKPFLHKCQAGHKPTTASPDNQTHDSWAMWTCQFICSLHGAKRCTENMH